MCGAAGLTGEGGAAHDLLVLGECLGLRAGPDSASSPLSRPSFRRASMRTLWGSNNSRSLLAGTECPELPSATAALCDFRIMLAGSFLGFGATAGGLLGSVASGGRLDWGPELMANGLNSGGLFGGSWVTGELTEVFFGEALWRSCSKSTVAPGLLLDIPAGGGRCFAFSGCGGGPGSSMKSEGGGIRPRSISEALVD